MPLGGNASGGGGGGGALGSVAPVNIDTDSVFESEVLYESTDDESWTVTGWNNRDFSRSLTDDDNNKYFDISLRFRRIITTRRIP